MTIEEKAKAYDEALENAKYYHSEMGDDVKCVLEEVFPVLNELDDERIREQILDYFVAKKVNESQPVLDSWIAWLEKQKQGEQKPTDIQSIERRAHEVFPDDDDENTPLYRQAFIDGAIDYIDCGCKNIAWSEEDDYAIEILLCLLDNEQDNYPQLSSYFQDIEKTRNWLKSLKARYTWKPSDYQLEAFESATENCAYSEYRDCLKELIVELKKLKGK